MSENGSIDVQAPKVEVIFEKELDSSEEPPMEEWSSILLEIPDENIKRKKYSEGLYDPGSGEICAKKYIAQSASSVFRHPYYNYPGVTDPGIREALLRPLPKVTYADDGQDLYVALCQEMGICPIRIFHRQLLEEKINLKYYGVNPVGVRAMALSLKLNRIVKVLDLTDNWLTEDACYHLGEMLVDNISLTELNLCGCRIGQECARRLFHSLMLNRSLRKINLSGNQLGDTGVEYLAKAVFRGADVTDVNLSHNGLSGKSAQLLAEVFETNNKLTHLNMSWNCILSPNAVYALCNRLSENLNLQELDLSWNSLTGARVGNAIKILLKNPRIRRLNLSNNKLEGRAITSIGVNLKKAKSLITLDLSYNTMTPDDALNLLLHLADKTVKLQTLLLENVFVTVDFLNTRKEILSLSYRKNAVITWGGIKSAFKPIGRDPRDLLLSRADAIGRESKNNPRDIALIVLELFKIDSQPIDQRVFTRVVRSRGVQLDNDLIDEITNVFSGPGTEKSRTINLAALVDFIKRKWPDRKLPPTPPTESVHTPKTHKAKKVVNKS